MNASTNINNHFFDGNYQQAWRYMMPQGLTIAESDFIWEVANLQPGHKVLDLMCGYGRHAFELAHRGAVVTAIDNLGTYVAEINEKAGAAGLAITALQEDAAQVSFNSDFDAAICMGNSFAFFNREDAVAILKNITANLSDEGRLIIGTWMIAEIAIRHFKERDWHYAGEFQCVLHARFLFQPTRIETEQTIIAPDQSVEKRAGVDYIFSLAELEIMAEEAGLRITDVFSTPRKKKFAIGDGAAYVVLAKA